MSTTARPWRANEAVIPFDQRAEEQLTGLVIRSSENARLATQLVTPSEFYVPELARLYAAATQLPAVVGIGRRVSLVAQITSTSVGRVDSLVGDAFLPVPRKAQRVRNAARRRRIMGLAAELYNHSAESDPSTLAELAEDLCVEAAALAVATSSTDEPQLPAVWAQWPPSQL